MAPAARKPEDRSCELIRLYRKATEELGLSPSDAICKDIEHLATVWNDAVYGRVIRAVENLERNRDIALRMSDRVPPPDAFDGLLELASAPTPAGIGTPVRVAPAQFVLHTIVSGLPGKGKTWFCRFLMQLIMMACPWVRMLIFDPNRSYKGFCTNPRLWLSVPWHELRLNPFVAPPDYPQALWLAENVDLLSRGELLHSKYLISKRLDNLVEKAHSTTPPGESVRPPSPHDLRDNLAHQYCRPGSKDDLYRQSALNVLDGRLRTSGNIYDCACGMEPLLTNTRARISTEGLAPVESLDFFINNLIHFPYRRRCTQPLVEPPDLNTLIVIEEAQTVLEHRHDACITFYQELLLRARALGLGFVFITQDISHIDPIVLAACSNFFIFGQSTAENKRVAQNTLDLSSREAALLGDLPVGECFMRFAGHPTWPHPFIARIPG